MEEKTFKGSSIERSKEKTIKILFAIAFVWALHVSHTYALAGMAETVYKYEYSPGLYLNIGAPSDICPAEYGNQRCMWVEPTSYSSTSNVPYFRSPTFITVSDNANGYIAGQTYKDKQWILFDIKNNEIVFTAKSEDEYETIMRARGGIESLYNIQLAKDHFKKAKEPFDFFSLIFIIVLLVIFVGIPGGILFGIYKIIKKIFYPAKNIPVSPVDITVNTAVPIGVPTLDSTQAVIPPTATVPASPTFTNNVDIFKKLGAIVFILLAFLYVGNTFMSSSDGFSLAFIFPKDKPLGGKVLYKKISNKTVIKEVKSLTLIHEQEGLIRDNLAVYRCNFIVNTFYDCVVQEKVAHPSSFVRVTNIFGKDSEFVYVVEGENVKYKILPGANATQFRPLYPLDGGVMGLYAGDNSQLYKGDKKIDVGIGSSPYDSMFFKEYRVEDISAVSRIRSPYLSLSANFDGDIQFISDGKNVFHGNGKASTTDTMIRVTKVEEADFTTFKPYQQPIKGTGYLKYATDKERVYCDDVSLGEDGYFVSNELLSTTDSAPSSFQVLYPKQGTGITEQNVGVQIAKTNSQVFVNCALYPEIDAVTFQTSSTSNVFTDKNNTFYLSIVASGTAQEAILSTLSPSEVQSKEKNPQAPSYIVHTDSKEGFSIELPSSFIVRDDIRDEISGKDNFVFFAHNKIRTQLYSIAVGISSEKTSITESEIFNVQSNRIESGDFEVMKDEKIKKGSKTIRLLESKGTPTGSSKQVRRLIAIYTGNNKLYIVTSAVEAPGWEENKEMMKRLVLSFTVE